MVTVITVCYQAAEGLEATIQSVLKQKNCEIEYIIKDGGSTDNTLQVVEKYRRTLETALKGFRFITGRDGGIFDAMNVAVQMAQGEWVIYMNAGDRFCRYDSLATLLKNTGDADIVHGDVYHCRQGKGVLRAADEASRLPEGGGIHHQAAIIRTDLMKETRYDTQYRFAADHDFFMKCYFSGKKFQCVHYPIALFEIGGASYQNIFDAQMELRRAHLSYGTISPEEYEKECKNFRRKKALRKLLPQRLYRKFQSIREAQRFSDKQDVCDFIDE